MQCNGVKFSSGGREDIDVRMLGRGRPFVIEVTDPRRALAVTPAELQIHEAEINSRDSSVRVNSFHFTDAHVFESLAKSAEEKIKAYACFVQTKQPVS